MQVTAATPRVVAHGLVEAFAEVVNALDQLALLGGLECRVVLRRLLVAGQVRRLAREHLAAKGQRNGGVGHLGVGPVAQTLCQPDIFGLGKICAGLGAQDVDDGTRATDGQAAVAAETRAWVPGGANPVVVEEVVEVVLRVGAEDGIGLKDEEPLGGREDSFIQPKGGKKAGDLLLGGDRHIGGDVGQVELAVLDLLADRHGLVDKIDGLDGAHEAEAPVRGHNGHEVQHQRGQNGIGTVLDQQGDFGCVEGRPLFLCILQRYFGHCNVGVIILYVVP